MRKIAESSIGRSFSDLRAKWAGLDRRTKWSRAVSVAIAGTLAVTFIVGGFRFADAPFRLHGDHRYYGKYGRLHTEEDYKALRRWEKAMLLLWPTGMVTFVLLNWKPRPLSKKAQEQEALADDRQRLKHGDSDSRP